MDTIVLRVNPFHVKTERLSKTDNKTMIKANDSTDPIKADSSGIHCLCLDVDEAMLDDSCHIA